MAKQNYHTASANIATNNMDARHERRIRIVQDLFAYSFKNEKFIEPHKDELFSSLIKEMSSIDAAVVKYAPKFPLEKISKIDLAILRLAIFELVIHPVEPKKVVINEAVELAKELGGEKSYLFINGVLGKLITNE